MVAYWSSQSRRVAGLAALVGLGLGALSACGGGTVTTVTVTDTATVTVSAAATTPVGTAGPATSGTPAAASSATTAASTPASGSPSPATSASAAGTTAPAAASGVPTSAAQETILTVRIEAYDPATGTLTFVPQDLVETEGNSAAVLSDPAERGAPVTAQVTAQTNVKFLRFGADIGAALAAGDVYCNMVLDGPQVTYLWELYAT